MPRPETPETVTVVAARYDVALDSGRHLAPGEAAAVRPSPRLAEQLASGALRIVPAAVAPQSPAADRQEADQ